MLENLLIKRTRGSFHIPNVSFNASTGDCIMEGESYPEDPKVLYTKIFTWLQTYFDEVNAPINFNLKLTYFNTSSSKALLDLLTLLKEYKTSGGEVTINWYHPKYDVDNIEEANDFMEDVGIDMKMIAY